MAFGLTSEFFLANGLGAVNGHWTFKPPAANKRRAIGAKVGRNFHGKCFTRLHEQIEYYNVLNLARRSADESPSLYSAAKEMTDSSYLPDPILPSGKIARSAIHLNDSKKTSLV